MPTPHGSIPSISLTEEENKKLDEALSQVYQVPEAKRLVDHKLYMGEDYLWADDLQALLFLALAGVLFLLH